MGLAESSGPDMTIQDILNENHLSFSYDLTIVVAKEKFQGFLFVFNYFLVSLIGSFQILLILLMTCNYMVSLYDHKFLVKGIGFAHACISFSSLCEKLTGSRFHRFNSVTQQGTLKWHPSACPCSLSSILILKLSSAIYIPAVTSATEKKT